MTETLSIVELIWIAVALVAEGFAARGLYKWIREDQQRRRDGFNGPLEIFYRGKIRLYAFGLFAFFLCLVLGVEAALVPSLPDLPTPGLQTIVAKARFVDGPIIIIVVVVLFALALVFDDRDRTLTDRAHDKKAEQRLLSIEAAARHAALRADVAETRADSAEARADGAETRADGAERQANVAATRADIAERWADVAATRADIAERRADGAETRADVAATRADVAEQRADTAVYAVDSLTPRVDNAEGEITEHTGDLTDHTDRLGTLEGTKERPDG